MIEPLRLLETEIEPYTRGLLASAMLDEPDDAALARAVATFSQAALVGALGGATAGSVAGKTAAGASVLPGATAASSSAVLKGLGIGALCGALVTSGAEYAASRSAPAGPERDGAHATVDPPRVLRRLSEESRVGEEFAPLRTSAAAGAPDERTAATPGAASPSRRDEEPVASSRGAPSQDPRKVDAKDKTSRATASVASKPDALAAETATIDRARSALAAGDTAGAFATLEAYWSGPRTGVLDREATIVRIDALVTSGQRRRAQELARDYLARFPGDPHAARLAELVKNP